MVGAADERNLSAWVDAAGLDDAQVGTAIATLSEGLEPAGLVHPAGEGGAGRARNGDLEHALPHLNLLVDQHIRPGDPLGGEVLPEVAITQHAVERALPVVELLAGLSVDGLLGTAVVGVVPDGIPHHAGAVTVVGPRYLQVQEGAWLLIDARVLVSPMRLGAADSDVRGDNLHAHLLWHTSRAHMSRSRKRASAVTRS